MRKWIFLLCLLLAAALPVVAGSGVLTVDLAPYDGAQIRLYAVAETEADDDFALTPAFMGCGVDLTDHSAQAMTYAAGRLVAWVQEKGITPTKTCVTDAQGQGAFEGLGRGVYLVAAEPFRAGAQVITPNPFLVYLPTLDSEGAAHWFLTAQMKYTQQTDDETSPDTGAASLTGVALLLSAAALFLLRNREKT